MSECDGFYPPPLVGVGAMEVAAMLEGKTKLAVLFMTDNKIGAKGAETRLRRVGRKMGRESWEEKCCSVF